MANRHRPPKQVVHRAEIYEQIQAENRASAWSAEPLARRDRNSHK